MNQEMRALEDEVLMETVPYEEWALTAAYRLSLVFECEDLPPAPGSRSEGSGHERLALAEARLTWLLAPLSSDHGNLPACLSPERPDAQSDDTSDQARLVRTLYGAATGLQVYVDSDSGEIDVLVVGMKVRPPNRYLLSMFEEDVLEFVASEPGDLRALYRRLAANIAQVG